MERWWRVELLGSAQGGMLVLFPKTTATGGLTKSAHPGKLNHHSSTLGELLAER